MLQNPSSLTAACSAKNSNIAIREPGGRESARWGISCIGGVRATTPFRRPDVLFFPSKQTRHGISHRRLWGKHGEARGTGKPDVSLVHVSGPVMYFCQL